MSETEAEASERYRQQGILLRRVVTAVLAVQILAGYGVPSLFAGLASPTVATLIQVLGVWGLRLGCCTTALMLLVSVPWPRFRRIAVISHLIFVSVVGSVVTLHGYWNIGLVSLGWWALDTVLLITSPSQ